VQHHPDGNGLIRRNHLGAVLLNVTGVNAGDNIVADLPIGAGFNPNGAGSLSTGFVLVSAYATTTGVIGFTIDNFTGAATSSFAQATTTVEYRDLR
jgi:hypothetical protein